MALVATAPAVDNIVDSGYVVSNIQFNGNENNNMSVLSSRLDDLSDPAKWIAHEESVRRFEEFRKKLLIKRGLSEYC
jgi:hypothetical protein